VTPDAAAVVAASNAWIWYPDDATVIEDADHLLVRWPDRFGSPPELQRVAGSSDPRRVVAAVTEQVRAWDEDTFIGWVKLDAPVGLEEELVARGGQLRETVDVLAQSLVDVPDLAVPAGGEIRWRNDPQAFKDGAAVAVAAFEQGSLPDDDRAEADAAEYAADFFANRGGSVVAYVDGRPAGTGGLTFVDGVARLWGGAVHPDLRGRGIYRAVLAERLRYAAERGGTIALVKGRVQTSGPILRRAGFVTYGQERSYRVPL